MARKQEVDEVTKVKLTAAKKRTYAAALDGVPLDEDGRRHPEQVVEVARNKRNPLHDWFTWDDSEAARLRRIDEARALIRVVSVEMVNNGRHFTVPTYVNLISDRKDGGGYRETQDVLADAELCQSLQDTAMSELRGWMRRFEHLAPILVKKVQKATGIPIHPSKRKRLEHAA